MKKDCIYYGENNYSREGFCTLSPFENHKCDKCKHYHKSMIFYIDELPCSCNERDCPFNYDTNSCKALRFRFNSNDYDLFVSEEDRKELQKCLDGDIKKRYSKCPLRLTSELRENKVPPTSVEKPKAPRKSNRFVAPSLEEVKVYAKQKGHSDLADKFYEYFSEGDWTDSKGQKVKNWKQKFITWATYNSGGRKGAETKAVKHEYDYLYDNDLDQL